MEKIKMLLLTLFLTFLCCVLDETIIRTYGFIFYFTQFFYATYLLLKLDDNYKYFFSPSFITILYISITFGFGHIVVANDIGMDRTYYTRFLGYESLSFITTYFLLCNMIVFLTIPFKKLLLSSFNDNEWKIEKNIVKIIFVFFLLIIASIIQLDLSLIGGSGDFSYSIKIVLVIYLVYSLKPYNFKIRFFLYFLILVLFVIGHFESKREIFFILFLFIFYEIVVYKITMKIIFRQLLLVFVVSTGGIYIILLSSIARGYGQFDPENAIDAGKYVVEYINSEEIYDALAANFEFSYAYSNSSNAINYVYNNQVDLLFGSTFLKVFFIPIPRYVLENKPRSMLDVYTTKVSPRYRADGGSFPIVVYSELFWNFHLFGLLFLFIFYWYFNWKYIYLLKKIERNEFTIKSVLYLILYTTLIQFVRGSGVEQWLVYAIIAIPLTGLLVFIKSNSKSSVLKK